MCGFKNVIVKVIIKICFKFVIFLLFCVKVLFVLNIFRKDWFLYVKRKIVLRIVRSKFIIGNWLINFLSFNILIVIKNILFRK